MDEKQHRKAESATTNLSPLSTNPEMNEQRVRLNDELQGLNAPPHILPGADSPGGRLKRLAVELWPLLVFAALSTTLVMPAWSDHQERILGGGELGGWLWRYWWMKLEVVALNLEFPNDPFKRLLYILSLGRFPETGNITDWLALSIPLDLLLGHPNHYNAKIWAILFTNALSGYIYVRYLTRSQAAGLVAGILLVANAFVLIEIRGSGLRQALLFNIVMALYLFDRMLAERKWRWGILTGILFATTAAFYWFYGLFLAACAGLRLVFYLVSIHDRKAWRLWANLVLSGLVAILLVMPFALPYMLESYQDTTATRLPEVVYGKDFPSLKILQSAPLRPNSPKENLLSSLARVITSSWPIEWAFDPLGEHPVPLVATLIGLGLGLIWWRKNLYWLLVFLVSYSLTWGPYLKWSGDFILVGNGEFTVRLPYWYAFKYVPMVSRLFGPYRFAGVSIIALAILVGLNLGYLSQKLIMHPRLKATIYVAFIGLYMGQLLADPLNYLGRGSNRQLPLLASKVAIPQWYRDLAKKPGKRGLIELPLGRQQDIVNYYQIAHAKKVYAGWATPGALPPILRLDNTPSRPGALLQWLSAPDFLEGNTFIEALRTLNVMPYKLPDFAAKDLEKVKTRSYQYVILHELGCYLMEPQFGRELYLRLRTQLTNKLGEPLEEVVEHEADTSSLALLPGRSGKSWVPSMYSPLLIPEPLPIEMRMVVYNIGALDDDKNESTGTKVDITTKDIETSNTKKDPVESSIESHSKKLESHPNDHESNDLSAEPNNPKPEARPSKIESKAP